MRGYLGFGERRALREPHRLDAKHPLIIEQMLALAADGKSVAVSTMIAMLAALVTQGLESRFVVIVSCELLKLAARPMAQLTILVRSPLHFGASLKVRQGSWQSGVRSAAGPASFPYALPTWRNGRRPSQRRPNLGRIRMKRSFAEKESAMKTLCAFLNGNGGTVLFGVTPQGKIIGIDLTDENVRSLPDLFRFFEPAVAINQERVPLSNGKWVYVLRVDAGMPEQRPFQYHGRACVRNGNRTDVMAQSVFEEHLMHRGSAARR